MKTLLLLSFFTATWLMAGNLTVTQGNVQAHTEVFGDSSIDPSTGSLASHLTMNGDIESIGGTIDVSVNKLQSDNADRDEHMVEAIESTKFPVASYTFSKVTKDGKGYLVDGILDFHGVKKPLAIKAEISRNGNVVKFDGKSSFMMSDYGVKPPKLLLLTVRDQIDLYIHVTFKKQ